VAAVVGPTVGVIEPSEDPASTIVRIGGDADWIARYLAGLPFTCEVLETPEVRTELRALARRLLRDTPR
jgi:predicted DNA-binding transcriptional regulator YafY